MMTYDEIIDIAISRVLNCKQNLIVGQMTAHRSDPIVRKLVAVEGNQAILSWNGVTRQYPIEEVFDPDSVRNEAMSILASQTKKDISTAQSN